MPRFGFSTGTEAGWLRVRGFVDGKYGDESAKDGPGISPKCRLAWGVPRKLFMGRESILSTEASHNLIFRYIY